MTGEFFQTTNGVFTIIISLAIGAFLIYRGVIIRRRGQASSMWPTANGSIINAWVEDKSDTDLDGDSSSKYVPRWQYQFNASGQTYTSDRISYGSITNFNNRNKAVQELTRYQVNQAVKVYFDPENPNECVLEPGSKGTMAVIIIGFALILIGLVGVYLGGYLPF